jgi:hypothetical protein
MQPRVDVDLALRCLHRVEVDRVADSTTVYAASNFRDVVKTVRITLVCLGDEPHLIFMTRILSLFRQNWH